MILIILIFIAGLIQEILITSYHKAIIANSRLTAAILTAIVALLGMVIISEILRIIQNNHSWYGFALILGYAIGKFCGAYLRLSK